MSEETPNKEEVTQSEGQNPQNSTQKPLKPTQLAMIAAMKAQLGNVTAAISEVGIDRGTHYNWMGNSPEYKAAIENVEDLVLDFAESSLHHQIMNHVTPATVFFLKTKGKRRGYQETKEVALSGSITNTLSKEQIADVITNLTK